MVKLIESYISSTTTGYPDYDKLMSDELVSNSNYSYKEYYKFEKGIQGVVTMMTPKEYFSNLKSIFGIEYNVDNDSLMKHDEELISKYASQIKSGTEFNMPYIDYSNKRQEGRHRMMAIALIEGDNHKVPVLEVSPTYTNKREIMEYALKKYPKDPDWAADYVISKLKRTEGVVIS